MKDNNKISVLVDAPEQSLCVPVSGFSNDNDDNDIRTRGATDKATLLLSSKWFRKANVVYAAVILFLKNEMEILKLYDF